MKRLFAAALLALSSIAFGATLNPIQLLNPTGSTSGQVIASTGASSAPAWQSLPTTVTGLVAGTGITLNGATGNVTVSLTNPVSVALGGTGVATLAQYNMLAGNGAGNLAAIGPGSAGLVLTSNGGAAFPSFQAIPSQAGRLLNVQKFTASGTYTPTTGATSAIVCGIGGGGGGTGAGATGASTYAIGGGGGGGGAFGCIRIASGLATQAVTIGAGGATASGAAGSAGTSTSFGALMVLPGGNPGSGPFGPTASTFFTTLVSSSAPSGTGTFLYSSIGYPSTMGALNPAATNFVTSTGGISPYGYGGGYGAGGNGAVNGFSASSAAGSGGSPGVIFVYEYQ